MSPHIVFYGRGFKILSLHHIKILINWIINSDKAVHRNLVSKLCPTVSSLGVDIFQRGVHIYVKEMEGIKSRDETYPIGVQGPFMLGLYFPSLREHRCQI